MYVYIYIYIYICIYIYIYICNYVSPHMHGLSHRYVSTVRTLDHKPCKRPREWAPAWVEEKQGAYLPSTPNFPTNISPTKIA